MEGEKRLEAFFRLGRVYESMYELYHANDVIRTLNPNDKEFSGAEAWHLRHYFDVGADALRIIVSSLIAHLRSVPGVILDFPSGSGRVTRHTSKPFLSIPRSQPAISTVITTTFAAKHSASTAFFPSKVLMGSTLTRSMT